MLQRRAYASNVELWRSPEDKASSVASVASPDSSTDPSHIARRRRRPQLAPSIAAIWPRQAGGDQSAASVPRLTQGTTLTLAFRINLQQSAFAFSFFFFFLFFPSPPSPRAATGRGAAWLLDRLVHGVQGIFPLAHVQMRLP